MYAQLGKPCVAEEYILSFPARRIKNTRWFTNADFFFFFKANAVMASGDMTVVQYCDNEVQTRETVSSQAHSSWVESCIAFTRGNRLALQNHLRLERWMQIAKRMSDVSSLRKLGGWVVAVTWRSYHPSSALWFPTDHNIIYAHQSD